jgi:SNF2 family DNA or RNA helicase
MRLSAWDIECVVKSVVRSAIAASRLLCSDGFLDECRFPGHCVADKYTFALKHEPNLQAKLAAFPYQAEAVQFVSDREYSAIFHEQGLGKTKIAIDVALKWLTDRVIDTVMIFTKKSLIANWERELRQHTHLRAQVLSSNSSHNYYAFTTPGRIVLAHFEVAKKEERRLAAYLRSRKVAVFIDESAKLKNPEADLTQVFFRLSPLFARRVIMTGTPIANRPFDIWAQIYFLDHGKTLGHDFANFRQEMDISKDLADDSIQASAYARRLSEVNESLQRIAVRETKNGGRIQLPEKEFRRIDCTWEPGQHALYMQVRDELRAAIVQDGLLVSDDQDVVLKRLLRLIQIASNPGIIDDSYRVEPGKFHSLCELCTDITRNNEKLIVWTSFNWNAEWLAKKLSKFGAIALHGKMPIERRNQVVNWFMENSQDRILVATPGAAKEGLTLTVANHVVFYDRTYSLDDYLQAQDRIHRVSQTRTCYVYTLLMQDSVDEWIESLIDSKRLAAQLTQGDIDLATYAQRAQYSFGEVLERVLGD